MMGIKLIKNLLKKRDSTGTNKQLMVRQYCNCKSEINLTSKSDLKLLLIVINRNKSFL